MSPYYQDLGSDTAKANGNVHRNQRNTQFHSNQYQIVSWQHIPY